MNKVSYSLMMRGLWSGISNFHYASSCCIFHLFMHGWSEGAWWLSIKCCPGILIFHCISKQQQLLSSPLYRVLKTERNEKRTSRVTWRLMFLNITWRILPLQSKLDFVHRRPQTCMRGCHQGAEGKDFRFFRISLWKAFSSLLMMRLLWEI